MIRYFINYECGSDLLTECTYLCMSLLWLSLNLALIIQCSSRFFPQFYIPRKMSSRALGGTSALDYIAQYD
jgi:hypothetical protein